MAEPLPKRIKKEEPLEEGLKARLLAWDAKGVHAEVLNYNCAVCKEPAANILVATTQAPDHRKVGIWCRRGGHMACCVPCGKALLKSKGACHNGHENKYGVLSAHVHCPICRGPLDVVRQQLLETDFITTYMRLKDRVGVCEGCHEPMLSMDHAGDTCTNPFQDCTYGCGVRLRKNDLLAAHEPSCPCLPCTYCPLKGPHSCMLECAALKQHKAALEAEKQALLAEKLRWEEEKKKVALGLVNCKEGIDKIEYQFNIWSSTYKKMLEDIRTTLTRGTVVSSGPVAAPSSEESSEEEAD